MDPVTLSALIGGASKVLAPAMANGGMPMAPPQRADGYAMGGMVDASGPNMFSSGATGGAYGGAFSQANIDGSNWTVSTGKSNAVGGGKSGGNGGLSPSLSSSQGGIAPLSPLAALSPNGPNGSHGTLMLLGLAALVYLIVK